MPENRRRAKIVEVEAMRPNDKEPIDELQPLLREGYPVPMPTEQFADRLQNQLIALLPAASSRPEPARRWTRITHRLGGLSMRQRIGIAFGGAGAAALVALLLCGGIAANPASAMEKMAEKIRQAKSLKVKMSMELKLTLQPGKPPVTSTMTQTMYWLAPKSYRMELKGGKHTSGVDGTDIFPAGKPGIHIEPVAKMFRRLPARLGPESPFIMLDKLGEFSGQADRDLGEKKIDGLRTRRIRNRRQEDRYRRLCGPRPNLARRRDRFARPYLL